MNTLRMAAFVLVSLFSLACMTTDERVGDDESAALSEDLQERADEASEATTSPAASDSAPAYHENLTNLSILPDQCCILGFSDGSKNCGDFEAIKLVANTVCKSSARDQGASSYQRVSGHCRDKKACPQYRPPPPPPPPPPPGYCPNNQQCCEVGPTGKCLFCRPPNGACP